MPNNAKVGSFSRRDFVVAASAAGVGGIASHLLTKQLGHAGEERPTAEAPKGGADQTPSRTQGQAPPQGGGAPLEPPNAESPDAQMPQATKKLGWAIVGLGKLALEEVLPAFGLAKHSKLVALVSGHPDKAKKVAEAHGLDAKNLYGYDNYDTLKDNPAVDIIYIILPNSMHAEYTIRGFEAGKHVLCEKPMAPSIEECQRMIDAGKAAGKKLMIAYRLHYEPFNKKVIEMCSKKELGALRSFSAMNVQTTKAPNIRLSSKLAGGPLGDIGIYCINAARYVAGEEPIEVMGMAHQPADDPNFREVPAGYAFTMRFPSGLLAHCDCSFQGERSSRYRVNCADGYIDLESAFPYFGQELRVSRKDGATKLQIEPKNHFTEEMDHFSQAVMSGKESDTPGEEGLADMRVIKAIEESARTGALVKVAK
ncbi:Gfo/Idh/MocA family protein [Polyangium aurulentum]|uniref:Gfo/Idh/MocA family protein n=1 Tax=Polyangium aurulentum TaxID=2567896 RepID=UPI0019808AB3|nr:Gfo/Idh/MocA family oxidoreductase [Polyangium aurulentum]UQA56849.1 Gfo/Idh/MocA family oxidoreductase [Polyangium aurulentum]